MRRKPSRRGAVLGDLRRIRGAGTGRNSEGFLEKKIKKILLLEAGSDEAPPRVHSVDVQCATLLSRIVQPVGQCTFGLTHGRF